MLDLSFLLLCLLAIALAVFRVAVPQLRGLWHSWKELKRGERLHKRHMEGRRQKSREGENRRY